MKQQLFILLTALAFTVNINSQEPGFTNAEVIISPYKSTKNGEYFHAVLPIGSIHQKMILQGCPYSDLYTANTVGKRNPDRIVVIDKDLIDHKTFSLQRSFEDKDLVYENMLVLNEKIYTFHSYYNKEKERQFLFMDEFDLDKWDYKNQLIPIVENDCGKLKAKEEFSYQFLFSPDSSKLAIVSLQKNSNNYTIDFGVDIFDKRFEPARQYRLEQSLGEATFVYNPTLDNQGNIFALLQEPMSNSKQWQDYVIKVNSATGEFEKFPLQLADKKLTTLSLSINLKNIIQIMGFYTQNQLNNPIGIVSYQYDNSSNAIVAVDNKPFTDEFIQETAGDKGLSKFVKGKDYDDYTIGETLVLKKPDNGLTYCFEKVDAFQSDHNTFNPTTGMQTTVMSRSNYHYSDIYVIDTDETGKINWTSIVKKNQSVSDQIIIRASFNALYKDGKTHLLFFDMYKKSSNPFNRKTPLALVEIDEKGAQKKEFYPLETETKMWYSLRYPTRTPDNTFYLYGLKGLGNGGYASVQIK